MAIGEYHKSDCNQSRGVSLTLSWKGRKGGMGIYIIYNYKQGRYIIINIYRPFLDKI